MMLRCAGTFYCMVNQGDEDPTARRARRRARVQAIALYTELTVAYKELIEAGRDEQAELLAEDIARVKESIASTSDE
jgi:hypothetical protein